MANAIRWKNYSLSIMEDPAMTLRCSFCCQALILVFSPLVGFGLVGCGSQTAEPTSAVSTSQQVAAGPVSIDPVMPATDVVSQFLDLVRRGGGDSSASALLTAKAQSELIRIGRTVQPIGSPNAKFVVTRDEPVPDNPQASLVHSVWSEPKDQSSIDSASSGEVMEYQVVWALQNEAGQWRISGLAMEIDPTQSPLIVNFEDGNRMAELLAETESSNDSGDSGDNRDGRSGPAATKAAAADSTPTR